MVRQGVYAAILALVGSVGVMDFKADNLRGALLAWCLVALNGVLFYVK